MRSDGERRVELAAQIDEEFFDGKMRLVPDELPGIYVADASPWTERFEDVVLALMVQRLDEDPLRLVDHAWGLRCPLGPWRERLGLVSEPYRSEEEAEVARGLFSADDGFEVHIWPKARSAHNPGSCVVIVVLVRDPVAAARWAGNRIWRDDW